jgi:hypothetical protein
MKEEPISPEKILSPLFGDHTHKILSESRRPYTKAKEKAKKFLVVNQQRAGCAYTD